MKRYFAPLLLALPVVINSVHAEPATIPAGAALLADIVIFRPVGLAVTIAGGAVFVGISPFTAFANIPSPHNAFQKTAEFLVNNPGKFTFVRPLGVYYADEKGQYHLPKKQ